MSEIEEKLSYKHQVDIDEVEDILFDEPHVRFVEKGHQVGADFYAAYGQTSAGRWLIIYFVLKNDNVALVISARDMEQKERRYYARQ